MQIAGTKNFQINIVDLNLWPFFLAFLGIIFYLIHQEYKSFVNNKKSLKKKILKIEKHYKTIQTKKFLKLVNLVFKAHFYTAEKNLKSDTMTYKEIEKFSKTNSRFKNIFLSKNKKEKILLLFHKTYLLEYNKSEVSMKEKESILSEMKDLF